MKYTLKKNRNYVNKTVFENVYHSLDIKKIIWNTKNNKYNQGINNLALKLLL